MSLQSCHGKESNSVKEEGDVAPSSAVIVSQVVEAMSVKQLVHFEPQGNDTEEPIQSKTPSGKKLRSNVEVQKYLNENPEYTREGVKLSQFSFQIPKPQRDNYVRKRPARDDTNIPAVIKANPVALDAQTALQPTQTGLYDSPSKKARKE